MKTQHSDLFEEKDACGVGFIYRPNASYHVIDDALTALARVEHRGACAADQLSGDGAGILTSIPWQFLSKSGWQIGKNQAVGMFFLPTLPVDEYKHLTEECFIEHELQVLDWRTVPIDLSALGPRARSTCPRVEQVLVQAPLVWDEEKIEQRLLIVRKCLLRHSKTKASWRDFSIASLSTKTIVYKALSRGAQLKQFYLDLNDQDFTAQWAVFHRRFSTNTMPRWALAQPFRALGHNGEINSVLGNRNWAKARESFLHELPWLQEGKNILPLIDPDGSDSASLDDALEMLLRAGKSVEEALMILVPEAHEGHPSFKDTPSVSNFYEYYAALQEPWDGPALVVFSDGNLLGACSDRNGLRPARFAQLSDGAIFLCSEAGALELPSESVVRRGRLGPGQMFAVDLKTGELKTNVQIKKEVSARKPYEKWLEQTRKHLKSKPARAFCVYTDDELVQLQNAVGFTKEDLDFIVAPMADSGAEPVFSMGDDAALAVLSSKPRVIYDYFKQRFAQVTNPPIDHMREKLVMSLDVHIGKRLSLYRAEPSSDLLITLHSPVLNESEFGNLMTCELEVRQLSTLFDYMTEGLNDALTRICAEAEMLVREGASVLVLTDRYCSETQAIIPPLMAVGAIHHHLIDAGLRLHCSLVVETSQCWNTHHFACLLGYGAQAVYPFMAFESVRRWLIQKHGNQGQVIGFTQPGREGDSKAGQQSKAAALSLEEAQSNYRHAIEHGLLKILSKMGISTLSSYVGAQIFECIGLASDVIEMCFDGTVSRVGGLNARHVESEVLEFHKGAYPNTEGLRNFGLVKHRNGGEYHGNNPSVVKVLHKALQLRADASATETQKRDAAGSYLDLIRQRPPAALRDLLECTSDRQSIDIGEVEPASEIMKRFCTGGMSLGSLSQEAHETVAVAMNRIGGKSNSGEGGEDPLRYHPIDDVRDDGTSEKYPGLRDLKPGDSASSAIRQVASGRFGVTPEYLVSAKQLEIKMAQGSKPGEGGQLPGHKVTEYIAKVRGANPGTTLISPPPHHDIYSIEDLAQLIFDLNEINPKAKVSVKLVSEIGIGTIATGVAKANADVIQVSGHDGGTGASPLSSIKHAGMPWELGLSEVHQALLANGLRERVLLRVDGGLRSGWDVIIAALLGAQEFGFGTIALIAAGCIMARVCHTNNCPVGITSQKEHLRQKFNATPGPIIEFFTMVAEEVRVILARLGYRSLEELIGNTNLIRQKTDVSLAKTDGVDLSILLSEVTADAFEHHMPENQLEEERDYEPLDELILNDEGIKYAVEHHETAHKTLNIKNTDRTVGARLSGAIVKRYGNYGFGGRITLTFKGSAGQSFGAFNTKNVALELIGEANDYVGKGMNGGEIAIRPFEVHHNNLTTHENTILGNTCLYGATGGALYAAGQAGERFGVRNSNAIAVIEGAGDHCCEYMTGGTVVVLGDVGRNFGAGMTGGTAFVLDEHDKFNHVINLDCDKELRRVGSNEAYSLKDLIGAHHAKTGSARAAQILAAWEHYLPMFWQIIPCEAGSKSAVGYAPSENQNDLQPALAEGFVA
ncbi:MAG TPA: glutamate synthase large subunit [Oculatellaceae cyanobacterium]